MVDKSTRRSVLGTIGVLSMIGIVKGSKSGSRSNDGAKPLSENEIKYAKGDLPSFLKDTILNGETTALVAPPEIRSRYTAHHDFEHILALGEANTIRDQARQEYIKEYGVDPRNPRAEVVHGKVMHKEKVRQLVNQGKLQPGTSAPPSEKNDGVSTNDTATDPGGGTTGAPAKSGERFI